MVVRSKNKGEQTMRFFVLLAFLLLLSTCSQTYEVPLSTCTVIPQDTGVLVQCINGTSGFASNGKNGADGKDGAQGQKGDTGTKGDTGNTGATGSQGIPGIQGVPGSSVTTVKFCDDYVPVYPSSFPEYGLCIDNKLYGVYYSASLGVFLAYLPPGRYQSTNNSQACIFTVTSGCEVSS